MTTAHTRIRQVRRTIIGSELEIRNALTTADRQGRFVSAEPARRTEDGRWAVSAVLVERYQVQPAQRPAKRPGVPRRYKVALAVGSAVLVALAGLGVLLGLLLQWLAAHALIIIGALIIVVALMLALRSKTGVCMGLHCEGCGH